jgi:plasmid stability protein
MKRLVIDLDDDLHRRIKVKAAKEGVPVAVIIRRLVEAWAQETGFTPERTL